MARRNRARQKPTRVRKRKTAPKRRPAVPRRRKGESAVAYHDRLADLIYEARRAGDEERAARLEARAGELAARHPSIHEPRRSDRTRRGPGTYPWDQCMDDQLARYGDRERAQKVCGRIRADSRERYPVYWTLRGAGGRRTNPEQADYSIVVGPDEEGWHYWVLDERSGLLAAASTKPYKTEGAAESAAKRSARKLHERRYSRRPSRGGARSNPKKTSGRRALSSLLRGT